MEIDYFNIKDKVCIVTGGAGLLGQKHAEAIIEGEGIPVLIDISAKSLEKAKEILMHKYGNDKDIVTFEADITNHKSLEEIRDFLLTEYDHIDVLINNAANNPKVEDKGDNFQNIQFHNFPISIWNADLAVGLTGAFLCAQVFGQAMAEAGSGVILNISSDLGVIAPDQRIYRKEGLLEEEQTVKPVTYSVIKHGLIGLTKYLASYWASKGVRANALAPGGIFNGQDEEFLGKLTNLIPMGRMADKDEYKATVLYMISDASSYMTGATLSVDGGRTCW